MTPCYTLTVIDGEFYCNAFVEGYGFDYKPSNDDVLISNQGHPFQQHYEMADGAIEKYFNENIVKSTEYKNWLARPLEG